VPHRRWFEHYAQVFDSVEINNSFYRLPQTKTMQDWHDRAPRAFAFAMKASRFLTHMKKLKEPEEPIERLFSRARELRGKLGRVLGDMRGGEPVAEFVQGQLPGIEGGVKPGNRSIPRHIHEAGV
jgi:hypothetical protein